MKILAWLVVVMLPCIVHGYQGALAATDSVEQRPKIANPEQALDVALQVTGFAPRMLRVPSASTASSISVPVQISHDDTPFLSDSVSGRDLWRVTLESVDIRPEEAIRNGYDLWDRRSFEIEIDQATGRLVRARTVSREDQLPPEPSAVSATAELAQSGERYWNFVDSLPQITLLEALNAAAGCTPMVATEIIAQCVLYSDGDQAPRPMWIITSRGVPALEMTSFSHRTPEEFLGRARCVVDASTGLWLMMSNSPHPE